MSVEYINSVKPESHESEYDRAISMLNHSVDDILDIDERTYKHYVLDDWDWTSSFKAVTSTYIK